jgi:hypothetical protein
MGDERVTSHDQLTKDLLRTFFADFLALTLPDVASRLRLEEPVFVDKEGFTDWPVGSRRELDLLARVPVQEEGEMTILVHIEIEGTARPGMDDRLWRYYMQLRLRHEALVVPMVTYLRGGPRGMRCGVLREGFAAQDTVCFRYDAFGVSGCRSEEYLARREPLAWALAALMRPGRRTRAGLKLECLRRIAGGELTPLQRFLLVNFVETYLQLTGSQAAEYARLRQLKENREAVAMEMTWAEQMEARGMEKGFAKGVGQGVGALKEVVLRLLEQRFGRVPATAKRKIGKVQSLEPLARIAEKILVVDSIDELGL